ncbi:MAG TPA: DinB family protein [Dehalococcoidia bacterium]|jgi:hypothetical protein|nr:DinB family protein [Dehalococcoidia bacterium]
MTASNSRADLDSLIDEFNATRASLIAAATAVPPERRDVPFVGHWDLQDVIAHTVGWDYTNVEAIPDFAAGRLPAFFARYDADWGSINAELVACYRVEDWDALMQTLRDAQAAFVAALSDLNDTDLDRRASWNGRQVSLRGMLRAISRDEAEHVRQIEAFLRS